MSYILNLSCDKHRSTLLKAAYSMKSVKSMWWCAIVSCRKYNLTILQIKIDGTKCLIENICVNLHPKFVLFEMIPMISHKKHNNKR